MCDPLPAPLLLLFVTAEHLSTEVILCCLASELLASEGELGRSQHPPPLLWGQHICSLPELQHTWGHCIRLWPSVVQLPVLSAVQSLTPLPLLHSVLVKGLSSLWARWDVQRLRGDVVTEGETSGILAPALPCPSAAFISPAGTGSHRCSSCLCLYSWMLSKALSCRPNTSLPPPTPS